MPLTSNIVWQFCYKSFMGLEAECRVIFNGKPGTGTAHCGDGEISVKGDVRFRWRWKDLTSVSAESGKLTVSRADETAILELGGRAEPWLRQIRNPKSRLDKFGLKPSHRYAHWGDFDPAFASELEERAGSPSTEKALDVIFIELVSREDLPRLDEARNAIAQNGMIWAVWPKGKKELREDDIRNYALANGLVDDKVASFNDVLSGLKLVIPVALRKR